jgi:glycosyltransferase involved in cell wall biosynthesis
MNDQHPASPAFSVILLAHNAAGSVGQAIESILSQSLVDWELIAVDDGSTDTTRGYPALCGTR